MLDDLSGLQRIFTYKVMFDGGTAPNPFGGVCTLAICKPAIRRVAGPGDLIVGLAPGNEGRIVYCMEVTDKKSWREYIELCTNKAVCDKQDEYAGLTQKVPKSEQDQGDCIWQNADVYEAVRPTHSGHGGELDFKHDVTNGVCVLLSTKFWYFGKGDKFDIRLPESLKQMIPGRGHRSNGNNSFRDEFVRIFNHEVHSRHIGEPGVHGTPEHAPETTDKSTCARCRVMQDADDRLDEE
jgi:hypothetical protein